MFRPFLRPLELHAVLALLGLGPLAEEPSGAPQPSLRPGDLLLLLTDLQDQLQRSLAPRRAFPGRAGPGQDTDPGPGPAEVVAAVVPHVKYIAAHLDKIAKYFKDLVAEQDGVLDSAAMFRPVALQLSACLEAGHRLLGTLLAWPGLPTSPLLPALLAALPAHSRFSPPPQGTAPGLASLTAPNLAALAALTHLTGLEAASMTASVAAAHLRLLAAAGSLAGLPSAAGAVAGRYLARDWRDAAGERERGAAYGRQVEAMLSAFLTGGGPGLLDRLVRVQEGGITPVLGAAQESEEWPAVTRPAVGAVYKTLLGALVGEVRKLTYNSRGDLDAQFTRWQRVVAAMAGLTKCLKLWRNLAMLGALLKSGRLFLEHFIRHGVPLVERLFKGGPRRRGNCIELIKEVQHCTRCLNPPVSPSLVHCAGISRTSAATPS
jgi:Fanconi anemia group D2 protein